MRLEVHRLFLVLLIYCPVFTIFFIKMKSPLTFFAILLPITLATAQCTGRLESINITVTKSGTYSQFSTTALEFEWHRPMWIQQGKFSNYGMCEYWGGDVHYFVNTTVSKVPTLEFKNVDDAIRRNGTTRTDEELKWHLEAAGYDGIKLDVLDHGQLWVIGKTVASPSDS